MPSLLTALTTAFFLTASVNAQDSSSAFSISSGSFSPPQPTTTPQPPFDCSDPNTMSISVDFFIDFNCGGTPSPMGMIDPSGIGFSPGSTMGLNTPNGFARSARAFCATNGAQARIGYFGFSIQDGTNTQVLNAGRLNECINAQTVDDGKGGRVQGTFDKVALERQS
jgi:hypothetical protein